MIKRTISIPVNSGDLIRQGKYDAAVGAVASVVIPADPNRPVYIHHVQWSYDGTPTGGKITITQGITVLWEQAITAAGPGGQDPDTLGSLNTALTVTLAAGGGGVTGRLTVRAVRIDPGT